MNQAQTVPGLAQAAATRWPTREAVVCGARRLSFADLDAAMAAASSRFVAAGLRPGERVALWAPNSVDWIIACLGLQAAGGVLVPLNTRFRAGEAADILRRSGAAMAVAATAFLGTDYAAQIASMQLPAMRRVFALPPDGMIDATAVDGVARAEAETRLSGLTEDALSDIMFTSGTTGAPKGAMATHGQTVRTARLWADATGIGEGDRFLILWPFFHCAGYKAGWVVNLAVGATTLPEPVLEPESLLARVEAERVTFLPGPPTLFQTLLSMPARNPLALASVRVSITGAASVAPSLIEAMRGELGIPTVLTGYGLTESCGTATMSRADDPPEIVATSCGRAIPGIEIICADEAGRALPPGSAGEVWIRGQNVMQGYLDDPAATAAAIDTAGWLHTGDIGVLDDAGYLRITDRKKDMYITGGFNCYPAEIEKILLGHPAIQQVAVTSMPDARLGEVGCAHLVLKPGCNLTEAALISWSRDQMANYKVPRAVRVLAELPLNATGKVQKFKLMQPA